MDVNTQIYQPLQEVFNLQPLSTRYFGSSDHVAFQRQGIAAYFCVQEPAHYRENHHSQTDTFDKVIPDQANGASDGVYTNAAGMPTYCVSGEAIDRDDIRAHGKDERVRRGSFYGAVDFYYRFLKLLTSST